MATVKRKHSFKNAPKKKSTAIGWRADEIATIINKARSMGRIPAGGLTARIRAALMVLPQDRRRPLGGDLYKWFTERLNDIMDDLQSTPPTAEAATTPPQSAETHAAKTEQDKIAARNARAKAAREAPRHPWSDADRAAVVGAARGLKDVRNAKDRLQRAMLALPPDKRRSITDPNLMTWLTWEVKKPPGSAITPSYGAAQKERLALKTAGKTSADAPQIAQEAQGATQPASVTKSTPPPHVPPSDARPAAAPVSPAAPAANEVRPEVAVPAVERVFTDWADVAGPQSLGEVFAECAGRILGEAFAAALRYEPVKDALRGLVATALGQSLAEPPVPAHSFNNTPNPLRKPRVLIAGLKGHQMTEINDALKDKFVLRFWNVDQAYDALRRTATESDLAVGFTNFLPHSADAIMKDRSPQYVRHTGGLTSLKARLQELAKIYVAQPSRHHH